MCHRTCSVALAALFVLLAADAVQAQSTLRYKFHKGDRLSYAVEQKATMKFEVAGKDLSGEYTMRIEWTTRVLDVDAAGKAKIECKLDRLRLTMSGIGQEMTVDTDDLNAIQPDGQRRARGGHGAGVHHHGPADGDDQAARDQVSVIASRSVRRAGCPPA